MFDKKGFKVIMLNVRSLANKVREVENDFKGFDIICLCETWLTDNTPDVLLRIGGYTLYRLDRSTKNIAGNPDISNKGGGVCMYVLDKYVNYVTVLDDYSYVNGDIEQLWIKLSCLNVKQKYIGCIYRPPKGHITHGIIGIRNTLDHLYNFQSEIIMTGDFNLNYNLRHADSFQLLKELERDFDLSQIIESNTRITSKSATRIDLIFTNVKYLLEQGTLVNTISDHEAVYLVKKKLRCKATYEYIDVRSYQNYDKIKFQEDVKADIRWADFYASDNANVKWKVFESIIECHVDKYCPLKRIRIRSDSPQWFTKELIR